jgi:hypothetical protein
MKTKIFVFLTALPLIWLTSCQKASLTAPQTKSATVNSTATHNTAGKGYTANGCPIETVPLIAGQNIDAGTVTVSNDDDFIYVTYTTANGYLLQQTHLYVGNCEAIPVNKKGNPVPGQFPYKTDHQNCTTFTYQVPIAAIGLGNCGCIAAHAAVVKLNANGQVIDSQTGWGSGEIINPNGGNWGTKFGYCTCAGGQ